jgi:adenosylcobinamide-GDP ribazoletransferase
MINSFKMVLGFLTIFRVQAQPAGGITQVGSSAWAFPLVGGIIGVILLAAYHILDNIFPPFITAVLVVALWILLTGGLHLDGWTDCWDAMAASVSPEHRREILKDSRLGSFGAIALIVLVGLKVSSLASENFPATMLFLAPVIGRFSMVTVSYKAQCLNAGMAATFVAALDKKSVMTVVVIGVGAALLVAGLHGLAAIMCAYIGSLWLKKTAESRLEIFNGDVIGSVCELSEAVALLIGCGKW